MRNQRHEKEYQEDKEQDLSEPSECDGNSTEADGASYESNNPPKPASDDERFLGVLLERIIGLRMSVQRLELRSGGLKVSYAATPAPLQGGVCRYPHPSESQARFRQSLGLVKHPEQPKKNDHRDRYPDQPEENAAHGLGSFVRGREILQTYIRFPAASAGWGLSPAGGLGLVLVILLVLVLLGRV